jgi:glutathione S-transferase
MIRLIQFPWSPYCLVQKRILEFGALPHEIVDIPPSDRSLVWRLTKERYYQVPVLKHGKTVVFETAEDSQVVAKYLEATFQLGLFPARLDGIQKILWRYIESEVEGLTFKLNDIYYREFVAASERCAYVRHKERKFGLGCLDLWKAQEDELLAALTRRLLPFEQMLAVQPFLLEDAPRFVDFDLWGMLANFLFSGHHRLPAPHTRLKRWYEHLTRLVIRPLSREKLHPRHQRPSPRSRRHPQL